MAVVVAPESLVHEIDVVLLPITEVTPAPDNPRRDVGDVDELAQSIRSVGLIDPLIVTPRDDTYLVVCGHRRLAAAKVARLTHVPAIVRDDLDDRGRQEVMLVENLQRTDLTPLEEADAYRRLVELGLSQRELAGRVGRSQGHVSKRLALLELPEEAQAEVDSGGITLEVAQELSKLRDDPKRMKKVIAEVKAYGPGQAKWSIEQAVRALEREKEFAKVVAELEAKGETVVRLGNEWNAPKGHAIVRKESFYGDDVEMAPASHRKLPCHAVGVTPSGKTIELCNQPDGHTRKADRQKSGDAAAIEKRNREEAELEQAHEQRREFVATLLGKATPLPKAEGLPLVARALLLLDSWDYLPLVADWLDITPAVDLSETDVARLGKSALHTLRDEKENKEGATHITASCGASGVATDIRRAGERDAEPEPGEVCSKCLRDLIGDAADAYMDALSELAGRGERDAYRVAVALVLAYAEIELFSGYTYGRADEARGHLDLLAAHGYAISKAEKRHLEARHP